MTAPTDKDSVAALLDDYRPVSWRQRLVIIVLAIATAVGVVLLLLDPPGGVVRKRPPAPVVPECTASSPEPASGCVGGMATVLPPAPAASR